MTLNRDAFRQWILIELQDRGWTQSDLSKFSGLNQSYISRILTTGDRNPGLDFYRGIARALRIPLCEVLAAAGETPAPADLTDPDITYIAHAIAQLSPSARRTAQEAIYAILDTFTATPAATILLIAPQPSQRSQPDSQSGVRSQPDSQSGVPSPRLRGEPEGGLPLAGRPSLNEPPPTYSSSQQQPTIRTTEDAIQFFQTLSEEEQEALLDAALTTFAPELRDRLRSDAA